MPSTSDDLHVAEFDAVGEDPVFVVGFMAVVGVEAVFGAMGLQAQEGIVVARAGIDVREVILNVVYPGMRTRQNDNAMIFLH